MRTRLLIAPAMLALLGGAVRADDFLLLRDGGQKRGALSACDQTSCRLGAEIVPRTDIQWIGLGRDAPTPPAVRNQERDELHLANKAVQSVSLTRVDSEFVHATFGGQTFQAASSLPRASVAWIHLGLAKQGGARDTPLAPPPEKGKEKAKQAKSENNAKQAKSENKVKEQPASGDASVLWRFPPRVYIHAPARCAGCQDTLHVLELDTQDDMIVMEKSRVISTGWNLLTGSWYTYDPPVPLFPATTDIERFAFDGRFRTNVTHHFYLHHANRNLGGRPPPAGPAGGGPLHQTEQSVALGRTLGIPGVTPEEVHVWWRDRLADWQRSGAGQGGGGARRATGGCEAKQFGMLSGQAEYSHTLSIQNWPIIADERASRSGPRRSAYEKLRGISVYDVDVDLRFAFGDHGGRGRDVDSQCYTTDWVKHDSRGPRLPAPDGIPIAQSPQPHDEPDPKTTLDWLFGGQAQSVREGIGRVPNPVAAAGKAIGGVCDDLAKGARNFAESVRNVMSGAGILGDGTAGAPGSSGASGPPHAVTLHVRWFRQQGRITEYVGDIIAHAVEGQDLHYPDIVVSATRPPGSFDMPGSPAWSGANPKPPPPPSNFNWRP